MEKLLNPRVSKRVRGFVFTTSNREGLVYRLKFAYHQSINTRSGDNIHGHALWHKWNINIKGGQKRWMQNRKGVDGILT
jgi:hypothetical protein